MNVIVSGFHDQEIFRIVTNLAKSVPFSYAAVIYQNTQHNLDIKSDYFDWENIVWSANYPVDWDNLLPLDEELISKMAECETMVLKMMDRFETRKAYTYQERKDLYLKHLRFWNDLIVKKKINLFLASNIPHEVFDYVIYSLCKQKGIQSIFMYQSHIPDTVIVMNDWEKSSETLGDSYPQLLKSMNKSGSKEIELPTNFENYFKKHTSEKEDVTPFYMKKKSAGDSLSALFQSFSNRINDDFLNNVQVIRNVFRSLVLIVPEKKLFSFYEKNCQPFDKNNKYIYLPLHYQPELTTCPCAGAFVDQLVMAELLASCLPEGYFLYVKEHPKQKILGRSYRFYKALLSTKKIRLISRKTDSKTLITHSAAVATCIGTAGWEALFKGKQVVMFGHDFYQYAPGVFSIRTEEDCKKAIENIVQKKELPTNFKLKVFLMALSQVSINGYIDTAYKQITSLSEEENLHHVTDFLLKFIRSKGKIAHD